MTTEPMEIAKASADAAKATAETTGKGIDALREAGGFFARIFGGALEEYGAALKERAAFFRLQNTLAIADKVEAIRAQRRALGKITPIPMGTALPLLEKASLEDDSELQDMWAALIANSAEEPETARQTKTFTELLAGMTPADARFLRLLAFPPDPANKRSKPPTDADLVERRVTIENLMRLGCVEFSPDNRLDQLLDKIRSIRKIEDLNRFPSLPVRARQSVRITLLGRKLVAACSATPGGPAGPSDRPSR